MKKIVSVLLLLLISVTSPAQTLTIRWNANTEPDLAGYKLYWGNESGNYVQSVNVSDTFFVYGPPPSVITYFAVTAFDTAGNESDYSNEVVYEPEAPPAEPGPPQTAPMDSNIMNWTEGKDIRMLMVFRKKGAGERSVEIEWMKYDSTYSTGWHALPADGDTTWNWKVAGDTLVFNGTQVTSDRFNPNLKLLIKFRVRVNSGAWVESKAIRVLPGWELESIIILGGQP